MYVHLQYLNGCRDASIQVGPGSPQELQLQASEISSLEKTDAWESGFYGSAAQ